jgi:4-hydroxy-tetrahydrodipicolinate synthase
MTPGRLLTAMVTPLRENGSINYAAAQELAARLCAAGCDGVVVAGTTGEAPTLGDDETTELLRAVREALPDRTVVAGTGNNNTQHSIELSERACAAGADALLCVVPYYSKPTQEGIYRHFKRLSEVGPVIMYNIQSRTGVNMTAETTLRCAHEPGVIGVKEASGDLDQVGLICASSPPGFQVWSGDDSLTLPLLAVGCSGVISVISHLASSAMKRMIESHSAGDNETARSIHLRLLPVMRVLMTAASNPIPIKSVINRLGFPAGPFRLPLAPMPKADVDKVLDVVRSARELITFNAPLPL